ncbi:MAG TPA: polysaccharide deacetylase family protein [Oligoflexia bacterium]|nr:polysaccharide deacetylase family protein [Oligoflexia bacterium]HMR24307.1 polysaccharide deacetylase family protein [Oligoflexia bacterium]
MKTIALNIGLVTIIVLSPVWAKQISLSFDDAPRGDGYYYTGKERSRALVKSLKKADVPQVIFYANPKHAVVKHNLKRLKYYKKSGHLIGNHTWQHLSANQQTVDEFIKEVERADVFLKKHNLLSPYFRFPYLRRGDTLDKVREIREGLISMGYEDGYVTIDNYDWYMEALFQKALKQKRDINMENMKKFYVEILMKSIRFYDALAVEILGRSPKHVLLLHENDLAALFIGDLVEQLRKESWEIIEPIKSYDDQDLKIYPDVLYHGQGRVASIAKLKKYKGPINSGYEDEKILDDLFDEYKIIN